MRGTVGKLFILSSPAPKLSTQNLLWKTKSKISVKCCSHLCPNSPEWCRKAQSAVVPVVGPNNAHTFSAKNKGKRAGTEEGESASRVHINMCTTPWNSPACWWKHREQQHLIRLNTDSVEMWASDCAGARQSRIFYCKQLKPWKEMYEPLFSDTGPHAFAGLWSLNKGKHRSETLWVPKVTASVTRLQTMKGLMIPLVEKPEILAQGGQDRVLERTVLCKQKQRTPEVCMRSPWVFSW